MKILHSKLLIPKIGQTIRRTRDDFLWDKISRSRITTVIAGAGYGKTTFTAAATAGKDTVWYRLTESDRDFSVFLNYLAEGISGIHPCFGEDIKEYFHDERLSDKDILSVLTHFLHAMETVIDRELMIVIDDFHTVQECREIRDCIQFLIENIPQSVHIILISRTRLDIALSRLRVMNDIVEISENDLVFNTLEVSRLFEQIFGLSLSRDIINVLQARSQGWIAGLILLYHAIRGKKQEEINGILDKFLGSGRGISEYLEENVFSHLAEDTRDFLLKTSLLPRLNNSLCDQYLGIQSSGTILRDLEKNHLFTFSLDETGREYTYHHIFQDFLKSRANNEFNEKEMKELYKRAAALLEKQDMSEEAIDYYLTAEAYDEASKILNAAGLSMVMEGRMNLVSGFLDRMPQEMTSQNPWLVYIRANISAIMGMSHEAINSFQKAKNIFKEQGLQVWVDLCEFELGNIYYPMGYFKKAEEQYTQLLKSPSCDPMVSLMLKAQLVLINACLGKLELADQYFKEGMADTARITDKFYRKNMQAWLNINYCIRYTHSGDFHEAIACIEPAGRYLESVKQYRSLTFYYIHISMAYYHAGLFSKGFESASAGLKIFREKGFRDTSLGWILLANCMNCTGLKKISEALDYGEQAMKCFKELGSLWGEASTCSVLQRLYMKAGDTRSAEGIIKDGLKALETVDFPHIKAHLKMGLSLIRALQGNALESESLLSQACDERFVSKIFLWWTACIRSCQASLQGRSEEALERARECLRISQANGYEIWVAEQLILLIIPLATLYDQGEMREYLNVVFKKTDPEMRATLSQLEGIGITEISTACKIILKALPSPPPPGLKVFIFGRFQIYIGDKEIPSQSWTSKKAKMLFKLLVHYRSKGFVNKEVFMEHLWPEEDPQKTAKRFHVALATLRKIIEPDIHRGKLSSYILSEGDNYLLDLGNGGRLDVDEFEEACAKARKSKDNDEAIRHLLHAVEIFQGDFLEEDLYESWCVHKREQLNDDYLKVLASIVEYYELNKNYHEAIEFCSKYLAKDAYAEDMYQRLMCLHKLLGNSAMVKKVYDRCRKSIVDDLGCSLNKRTELLFDELIPLDSQT